MDETIWSRKELFPIIVALFALGTVPAANAEMYLGAGIGKADVELDAFAEDDSSKKFIVGYIFDLPAVDFSVEANYVDFGSPNSGPGGAALDVTGLDAFAVAGIDFGLVGLFAKAGMIRWDADAVSPSIAVSDDGTDSAYGVGVRFNIRSLVVRAEYEKFDIAAADDLDMLSASLLWRF